jgi:S1-C subfamily serine protease
MERLLGWIAITWVSLFSLACTIAPPPDPAVPGPMARQIVAERISAVVVTERDDLGRWLHQRFAVSQAPGDADGGSAAPISEDGYFLTADHVLARIAGRNVFIIYGDRGRMHARKARIVWRSESADLALLHIRAKTPRFYRWTPPDRWLSTGHGVIHGGIATGFKSPPGKLGTSLAPEGAFTRNRKFKIDIPLQPGDSGGPVVDAYGRLVGINSAVEFLVPMETAFFVDSEGNRPNTAEIENIIRRDRERNIRAAAP